MVDPFEEIKYPIPRELMLLIKINSNFNAFLIFMNDSNIFALVNSRRNNNQIIETTN